MWQSEHARPLPPRPARVRSWKFALPRHNAVSTGGLYLSEDELTLLTTALGGVRRGAFSIVPNQPEPHAPGAEWPYPYRGGGGYYRGGDYYDEPHYYPGRGW